MARRFCSLHPLTAPLRIEKPGARIPQFVCPTCRATAYRASAPEGWRKRRAATYERRVSVGIYTADSADAWCLLHETWEQFCMRTLTYQPPARVANDLKSVYWDAVHPKWKQNGRRTPAAAKSY